MRLRVRRGSNTHFPTAVAVFRPSRLANERTFLTWLRAASGLLLVGLAVRSASTSAGAWCARWVADGCLASASGVVAIAGVRWWTCERAMARSARLPRGVEYMVLAAGALLLLFLVDVIVLR